MIQYWNDLNAFVFQSGQLALKVADIDSRKGFVFHGYHEHAPNISDSF